jgi:hypothetical protein
MNTEDTKDSFTHVRNTTTRPHARAQDIRFGYRCLWVRLSETFDGRCKIHIKPRARCNSSRGFLPTTYSSSPGVTWPLLMDLVMSQRVFSLQITSKMPNIGQGPSIKPATDGLLPIPAISPEWPGEPPVPSYYQGRRHVGSR